MAVTSQQKKTPLFVFTSAPPATGQLLSRLITQPLDRLGFIEIGDDSLCAIVSLKEIEMSSQ